jgi:phospholipid/cholesterol/gamma-HCH transport system substrate-binding protein
MKKLSTETSVGIFVLIGLACMAWMTFRLGNLEVFGEKTYYVSGKFLSVGGLKTGASVELAGVQVGKVESITLDTKEMVAVVQMKILESVPLTDDVIASIRTSGLIGDKYIKLEPGGSTTILKNGDQISETESAIDIESLISKYAFGDVKN